MIRATTNRIIALVHNTAIRIPLLHSTTPLEPQVNPSRPSGPQLCHNPPHMPPAPHFFIAKQHKESHMPMAPASCHSTLGLWN
jgi:hypothetical protein